MADKNCWRLQDLFRSVPCSTQTNHFIYPLRQRTHTNGGTNPCSIFKRAAIFQLHGQFTSFIHFTNFMALWLMADLRSVQLVTQDTQDTQDT
ncbi:MAG: hypothetical protein EZS28_055756 [Streblomastix strix]|uniref:Uncharacterized protein n=1 Tax=Streblomastix strix TaxID=222440 RepID=A0A5J4PUU4_9EUKA|nr:MAG: hypothetical protein EZS28_055756 [Streblomastix strix]